MKRLLLVWLLALAACSTSTTTDVSDTTGVVTDTIQMAASDPVENSYEVEVLDTTYTLEVQSEFAEPQINERVAYVYAGSGLDVFETPDGKKLLGHIDYKARVDLTDGLVNSIPSDTMLVDGFRGRLVSITYKGKPAYLFSGYLVNLPVPDDGLPVVDYFSINLHLIKPGIRVATECDCDMMSSTETFEYENGITVITNSYYEGGGQTVNFKNRMTFQEVFLFASHFYQRMAREVPEIPKGAFEEEKEGPITIKVSAKGESITDIVIITEEGCYEEEGIHLSDDHVQMTANGGC